MVRVRIASVRVACFALAVSAAAICFSSRLSDASATPRALTIVAFGSSSTQGVGASSSAASYPAQLETMLRAAMPRGAAVDVVNRGIGGEDVDDMMVRLNKDVIAGHPNIVIWQTGSNDAMRAVPLDRFEQKTRAGIAAFRAAGIAVVLMEPQWCPTLEKTGAADGFRDTVRRIGADMGVTVIRRSDMMHEWIHSGRLTMTTMLAPDGLHMRDAGYHLLAEQVAAELLRMNGGMARPQARVTTADL
jgi:acyl-CoA thioesterase-1